MLFRVDFAVAILFFSINNVSAQFDTTYYVKYPDMLGLGVFQAIRNNSIELERIGINSVPNYIKYNTNGKGVTGFVFAYDKIYLAFGFKIQSNEEAKKGKSKNTNLVLQLNGNKLVLEAAYRNYKGFYEENTPLFIPSFNDTTPYYQDENLRNKIWKLKAFYFFNHKKFSYNAAYFGTFRQIKSASSWVLNANFYTGNIRSDSSMIPYYAQEIFNPYSYLNGISVIGFSFGGGGSGNIVVFKKFIFNATLTAGLEPQWRTYDIINEEKISQTFLSAALDFRSSFGFNSERFFFLVSTINDFTFNYNKSLMVTGNFLTTSFVLGYRFHFENKATHWLKQNKIYKMI
ncbi:MAG: DUF4421 family protein [Bacteroidia bacterium]